MIRGIVYKLLRGTLASGAAVALTMLTASPFGWVAVPIITALGKAIRVRLEKAGKKDLVKWVVI
jgi:hypothetical protein